MIVLAAIDPVGRAVVPAELENLAKRAPRNLKVARRMLDALGLSDVEMLEEAAPDREWMLHRWSIFDGCLKYHLTIPHHPDRASDAAFYLAAALAFSGMDDAVELGQMRLIVHELVMNALEHGTPRAPDPLFHLQLQIGSDRVEGVVSDQCAPFDPASVKKPSIHERVALRAVRGFGIDIAQKLLDELEHEHDGNGNRVYFSKSISVRTPA